MKPIHVSQKDLATWLGLGVRHIRSLTSSGVLTHTAKGYDLKASIHSYLTFLRSKTGAVSDERTLLLKAQADMQELKVRQREGELVERVAVAREVFVLVRQVICLQLLGHRPQRPAYDVQIPTPHSIT